MRANVGGEYDFDQIPVEGGLNVPLGGQAYGWVSARHVTGAADVHASPGGGEIDANALGSSFGLSLGRGTGFYAVGCGLFTDYDLGFSSDTRGLLASSTGTASKPTPLAGSSAWLSMVTLPPMAGEATG